MSAFLIFALSGWACWLIISQRPLSAGTTRRGLLHRRNRRPVPELSSEALPRLIRQLASLLAAGRTGSFLWEGLAMVLAVEQERTAETGRSQAKNLPQPTTGRVGREPEPGHDPLGATLLLVLTVQRASSLGLPTATAIRGACGNRALTQPGHTRWPGTRRNGMTPEQLRMWLDIAACFDVCEVSGAPVAEVLERLATTLEADHDAAALRETALAGPRATVKLLTWLPLLGLGLGMLMGVDPIKALLGSSVGWAVLVVGVAFAVVGRTWSISMIAGAARTMESADKGRRRMTTAGGQNSPRS